jgi:hypothetical protein
MNEYSVEILLIIGELRRIIELKKEENRELTQLVTTLKHELNSARADLLMNSKNAI